MPANLQKAFEWNEFLSEVSKHVPPQQFRAWIEAVRFAELTPQSLVIKAPTVFSRDWVFDHYKDTFKEVLYSVFGLSQDVKVEVDLDNGRMTTAVDAELPFDTNALLAAPVQAPQKAPTQKNSSTSAQRYSEPKEPTLFDFAQLTPKRSKQEPLPEIQEPLIETPVAALSVREMATPIVKTMGQPVNPKHTFDTFVVGASNQFAHAAARAVAEQPATQYNPLFIYSDAGLGKTHLLHAIGNCLVRANPKAKICYLSAEKFANDLIDSIHHGKMSQFRERYRDSYDMLLMDDIQFIAGKERTQEEFFHTFNALHSSRRQIVVTSDKFPKDIPGLEERIRTRFEWGLIADIQPPEIETRIAILRAKAELDDIFLPHDVALFLASNIKSNIRELEGSLIRLGAQASLSGSEISLDLAKQLLRNIIKEPSSAVTSDAILEAVSRHFAIKIADLKSKERSRKVALPRQIAMYLIRKYCDKSYPDIGHILGGKDHSTILHGAKTIASDIERDADIRRHVEEIQNVL